MGYQRRNWPYEDRNDFEVSGNTGFFLEVATTIGSVEEWEWGYPKVVLMRSLYDT